MYPNRNPDIKRIIINAKQGVYMLVVPLFLTLLAVHAWKLRYQTYKQLHTQEKIAESFQTLQRIAGGLTFFFNVHDVCLSVGIARCGLHPYLMLLIMPHSIVLHCLLQASLIHPYIMTLIAITSPITLLEACFVHSFLF